jgi:hypothetical protein
MTKTYGGETLATPKEIVDSMGIGFFMEISRKENIQELQDKLGLDFEANCRKEFEKDPETGSRILTYRMALKQLTPEDVEAKYGHDLLTRACSQENVNWLNDLTSVPRGTLEDALPHAAKYMAEQGAPRVRNNPGG